VLGAVAALWLAGATARRFARRWWRLLRGSRGSRHTDPVRREAGRLLQRLRPTEAAAPDVEDVRHVAAELQRLRFGASETWPEADVVFRRARWLAKRARRREAMQA
jgi:hypothetical protein